MCRKQEQFVRQLLHHTTRTPALQNSEETPRRSGRPVRRPCACCQSRRRRAPSNAQTMPRLSLPLAVLLSLCALSVVALPLSPFPDSQSNILIQWGDAVGMGVGPYSLTSYGLPPTPIGVYDEVLSLPLDGAQYWHATNGQWSMSVVRRGNSSQWFVFGTVCDQPGLTGNCARYPSPTNITSLILNSNPILVQRPLLKLSVSTFVALAAVLDGNLLSPGDASVDVSLGAPFSASIYSWSPSNSTGGDIIIGRNVSDADRAVPTLALSLPLLSSLGASATQADASISAHLECGACWCLFSNISHQYAWGASSATCVSWSNTPVLSQAPGGGVAQIYAAPYSLIVRSVAGNFSAFGRNQNYRFGLNVAQYTNYNGLNIAPLFGMNVTSLACGLWHCIALVSNSSSQMIIPFGDNTYSQLAFDAASVPNLILPDLPGTPIDMPIPLAFGGTIFSVGAIGATSFVLTGTGLWAWGLNLPLGASQDPAQFSFGVPVIWTNSVIPIIVDIPPGFSSSLVLPSIPSLNSITDHYSVTLHAQVNQSTFDAIRAQGNVISSSWASPSAASPSQVVLAWGASLTSATLSDPTWQGLPLGNRSVSSNSWFAGGPTIVELPISFTNWTSIARSATTVYVTGFPSASSGFSDPTIPQMFVWGQLDSVHGLQVPFTISSRSPTEVASSVYLPALLETSSVGLASVAGASVFACSVNVTKSSGAGGLEVNCFGADPRVNWATQTISVSPYIDAVISCGTTHCGLLPRRGVANDLYLWGVANLDKSALCRTSGSLPFSFTNVSTLPSSLASSPLIHLSLGNAFSIFASSTAVYGCGDTSLGQLGAVNPSAVSSPQLVAGSLNSILSIAAGASHSLVLDSNGVIYSFGSNTFGQLGRPLNSGANFASVQFTFAPTPGYFANVACVTDTSFAVTTSGMVYAWGLNEFVNLFGDALLTSYSYSATPLLADISRGVGIESITVLSISSSAVSSTVFAIASFNASSTPIHPTRDVASYQDLNHLKIFKFGVDPLGQRLLSPVSPGLYSHQSEIPTFAFHKFEYPWKITSSSGLTWIATNESRVFVMSSIANISAGPSTLPMTADGLIHSYSPTPILVQSFTTTLSDITAHEQGAMILDANGKVHVLPISSPWFFDLYPSEDFTQISCNTIGCTLINSTQGLKWLSVASNFSLIFEALHVEYAALVYSNITLSGCSGSLLFKDATNWRFVNSANGQTCVVDGTWPAYTAAVSKVSGGGSHFLVLTTDGRVYGLGMTGREQLPSAMSVALSSGLQELFPGAFQCGYLLTNVVATSRSSFVHCDNGMVYGWGALSLGQMQNFGEDLAVVDWYSLVTVSSPQLLDFGVLPSTMMLAGIAGDTVKDAWQDDATGTGVGEPIVFFAWTNPSWTPTRAVPPTAGTCTTPPPSNAAGWVCDSSNTWMFYGSLTIDPSNPLVVSGPIQVNGNLTIAPGSSVTIQVTPSIVTGLTGPLVNVSGCVYIQQPITIQPDPTLVKQLPTKSGGGTSVTVIESACSQSLDNSLFTAGSNNKGCRKYKIQQVQSLDAQTGRYSLTAVISIASDSCSVWWIILVSVVCGVILLAALFFLLAYFTPLTKIILPYRGTTTVSYRRTASGSQRSAELSGERSAEL